MTEIVLILVLILSFALYFPLNRPTENVLYLKTPLDDLIPFIPAFVLPYLAHWVVLLASLVYFFFFNRTEFTQVVVTLVVVNLTASAVFLLAQTGVNRPEIVGKEIFSNLVSWIYSVDKPYNVWPSLHVGVALIYTWGWWMVNKQWGIYASIFAALVILSTVFIKQHYLLDILGGAIFAWFAVSISRIISPR